MSGSGRDRDAGRQRVDVVSALHRAGLAAAKADSADRIYAAVADSLTDVGFRTSVYEVEADRARLTHSTFTPRWTKIVERHTGLDTGDFSVRIADVPAFSSIIGGRAPYYTRQAWRVLEQLFPPGSQLLAKAVARVLRVQRLIGVPVMTPGGEVLGMLFLLANDLEAEDVATAEVFAQLIGITMSRARLTDQLQQSLQAQKDAQARLLQAQKLEAIGRLTGGIAHGFNNLLTPAFWAVDGLGSATVSPAERAEQLSLLRASLTGCAELTRSLLAFGSQQVLVRRPVVIDELLQNIVGFVRHAMPDAMRVEFIPGAAQARVLADSGSIQQVLVNLALNSRDALTEGGRFSVATRVVHESELAGEIEIAVTDDGHGIDPAVLSKVLEPFFSTKGAGLATGLGLPVALGIIQQHHGSLRIQPAPGGGTEVLIRMPTTRAPLSS